MELFKDPHEALTFAFRFSSQQYPASPMSKLVKAGRIGSGKGLHALDGAGQAGMIMREVESLDSPSRACIVARYSLRFDDCPCCENQRMKQEYAEAVTTLAEWSLQWLTGLSMRTIRHAIIRSYFEKGYSLAAAAKAIGVPKATAYAQRANIIQHLKELDSRALQSVHDQVADMCGELAVA